MRNHKEYKNFTENDFIVDPYFQDWIINENTQNKQFWNTFFEAFPHKKEAGKLAKNFLENLVFKEDLADENLITRSLAKHLEQVERFENDKVINIRKKFSIKTFLKIAAIFGGVLLTTAIFLIYSQKDKLVLVKTEYGHLKSVVLPDSSLVVLNANSTIKFSKNWYKSNNREVWLQGEAFFDVRRITRDGGRIKQYEKFIVHTQELAVEVLGTAFDIRQRRGKTEVVLQTGRIKVSFKDEKKQDITMNPGDMLVYPMEKDKLVTTATSAADFSAWKDKKLLLTDPTAAEIVEYLEDNFGKNIILENPELGKRKIEGPILLTNLDDALFVLSTVLNTEIIKKDSTIIIRPR